MLGFLKQLKWALFSPVPIASCAALSMLLAYSGPFGTYQSVPFQTRLIYWSFAGLVGLVCGVTLRILIESWLKNISQWAVYVSTALILALFGAEPLRRFSHVVAADNAGLVPPVPELFIFIFMTSLSFSALRVLIVGPATPPERRPEEKPKEARLLQRLEPAQRGQVIRLSVFDHYVSVVTDRGEVRLLMRFGDALQELEGVPGLKVHRSHWVALDAVRGHENEKGRVYLLMSDGARVPVSRNFRAEAEARGLL